MSREILDVDGSENHLFTEEVELYIDVFGPRVELGVKSKLHGTLTVCKDSSWFRLWYADTCEEAT